MRHATRIATGLMGVATLLLAGCGLLPSSDRNPQPEHPGFDTGKLADYKPTGLGSPSDLRPNGGVAILCEDGYLKSWKTTYPELYTHVNIERVRGQRNACWATLKITEKEAQGFHHDVILAMADANGRVVDTSPIFTGSLDLRDVPIPEKHTLVILVQDGWQKPGPRAITTQPSARAKQVEATWQYMKLIG